MELLVADMSRNSIGLSLIFLANLCTVSTFPALKDSETLKTHLHKFAYSDSTSKEDKIILSVKKLRIGGKAENSGTLHEPRCGTEERRIASKRRLKRFVPHRIVWPQSLLTWKLEDPYNLLDVYDTYIVRNTLHRAFNDWSEASRRTLQFEEKTSANETTNFLVLFANGPHNDSLPFDGQGGVVAHGFYPMDGNLHFDAAEKWTLNLDDGINLYQTAVHEIGHLLGLEHSSDYKSVMFHINRPYDPYYHLGDDDVRGIRYLYAPWAWSYNLMLRFQEHKITSTVN